MDRKNNNVQFPYQKRSSSKKGEKFIKECVEAGSIIAYSNDGSGIRKSIKEKQINYDLLNNNLHESDIETVSAQYGVKSKSYGKKLQNFPLINPKINTLRGEELGRAFNYSAFLSNPDASNERTDEIVLEAQQRVAQAINDPNMDREDIDRMVREFQRKKEWAYQDRREKMANSILKYYFYKLDLKTIFNEGWFDVLANSEEIFSLDVFNGDIKARRVDPLTLFAGLMSAHSHNIEDAGIICEDSFQTLRYVIDNYHRFLKDSDIKKLEEQSRKYAMGYGYNYQRMEDLRIYGSNVPVTEVIDFDFASEDPRGQTFDTEGNVRVTRVVWSSMRQIGILTYYDDQGIKQKMEVHENYEPDEEKGEKVNWYWVPEWWEGTRLGDDIYVKGGPRPVNNAGYVGTIYNINSQKAVSLLDFMKPFQYTYNEMWWRILQAWKKWHGPMIEVDFAKIPKDWTFQQWMLAGEETGFLPVDSFKEGARGELAGSFNTTGKAYNPDMGGYIKDHWTMMQEIERKMSDIVGVTPQRVGNIEEREGVRNVQQGLSNAANITEPLFYLHDKTKERFLQYLLETAQYVLKDEEYKQDYMLDDMSKETLDLDGKLIKDAELGVVVGDSFESEQFREVLRSSAQSLVQRNEMQLSQFSKLYNTRSNAEITKQLEASEAEAEDRRRRMEERQMKLAQAKQNQEAQAEAVDKKLEEQKVKLDAQGQAIDAQNKQMEMQFDYQTDNRKIGIEDRKVDETIRHNKEMEEDEDKKLKNEKKDNTKK